MAWNAHYVSQYEEDNVIHFLFEALRTGHQKPRPSNEIDACRWLSAKEATKRNVRAPIRSLLKRCASDADGSHLVLKAG
ncbi:NUDIX domain-containing protein [Pseudomonas sp. DSP3-2-2]|uniref:NUDIX domain-containing protein n=1 Tax=unclassified Pseudomonas TaxID=196821 RepID=UPI003CFBA668